MVQKRFKGYKIAKVYNKIRKLRHKCATKIQKIVKGRIGRRLFIIIKKVTLNHNAHVIQRGYRNYVRRSLQSLLTWRFEAERLYKENHVQLVFILRFIKALHMSNHSLKQAFWDYNTFNVNLAFTMFMEDIHTNGLVSVDRKLKELKPQVREKFALKRRGKVHTLDKFRALVRSAIQIKHMEHIGQLPQEAQLNPQLPLFCHIKLQLDKCDICQDVLPKLDVESYVRKFEVRSLICIFHL
jgi:hypothetical protein